MEGTKDGEEGRDVETQKGKRPVAAPGKRGEKTKACVLYCTLKDTYTGFYITGRHESGRKDMHDSGGGGEKSLAAMRRPAQ